MTVWPLCRAASATSIGKTPLPAIRPSLPTIAADHSARGGRYEIDQARHLRNPPIVIQRFLECVLAGKLREKDRASRCLDCADDCWIESAAFQTDLIDSDQARALGSRDHRERRNILGHLGAGGYQRVRTDAAELVQTRHSLDVGEIVDHTMTTQLRTVGQDHIVSDSTVVSDVGVIHDQHAIADLGEHPTALGAAMDAGELANAAIFTDLEP